jgi:hypothetical protein
MSTESSIIIFTITSNWYIPTNSKKRIPPNLTNLLHI